MPSVRISDIPIRRHTNGLRVVIAAAVAALSLGSGATLAASQDSALIPFGGFQREITGLSSPAGTVIDEQGRIFIAESGAHRISVFDGQGQRLMQFGEYGRENGQFARPSDVAIGPNGTIHVVDTDNHRIQIFNRDGSFRHGWGLRGPAPRQFCFPQGVAVTAEFIYVVDTGNCRVQAFDHHGEVQRIYVSGLHHDDEFFRPIGIGVDDAGRMYVADAGRDFIKLFNPNGQGLHWGEWGSFPGLLAAPVGVAYHHGFVYVADTRNHRIQVFDRHGIAAHQWGDRAATIDDGQGQLHYPTEIAIAPDGSFAVVLETLADRAQIFGLLDGEPPRPDLRTATQTRLGPRVATDGNLLVSLDEDHETLVVYDIADDPPVRITEVGSRGKQFGEITNPGGIIIDAENNLMHVADTPSSRVQTFQLHFDDRDDAGYTVLGSTFSRSVDLRRRLSSEAVAQLPWVQIRPSAMRAGPDGAWYVLDERNAAILVFDATPQLLRFWGEFGAKPGQLSRPVDMDVDLQRGRVYVLDADNHYVHVFDLEGGFVHAFGARGAGAGEWLDPTSLVVAQDGSICVVDAGLSRVQRFSPDGVFLNGFDGSNTTTGALGKPRGISRYGDHEVVIVDYARKRARVFDLDGHERRVITPYRNPPALISPDADELTDEDGEWREVLTNSGTYLLRWRVEGDGVSLGSPFSVIVNVLDGADAATVIERSILSVDAAMPHHRHGMMARPIVRRSGKGTFLADGLNLHMPGYWELYFDVSREGITERARVKLMVQ